MAWTGPSHLFLFHCTSSSALLLVSEQLSSICSTKNTMNSLVLSHRDSILSSRQRMLWMRLRYYLCASQCAGYWASLQERWASFFSPHLFNKPLWAPTMCQTPCFPEGDQLGKKSHSESKSMLDAFHIHGSPMKQSSRREEAGVEWCPHEVQNHGGSGLGYSSHHWPKTLERGAPSSRREGYLYHDRQVETMFLSFCLS